MKAIELQELKKIELDIMEYIHGICVRNNIKYCIGYGTLLGAIRHKGFIPWDDDIDIVMPRPEYDKFVRCMRKEPNSKYILKTPDDEDYCYEFSKVIDNTTLVVEDDVEGSNIGVWVDIFPLDGLRGTDIVQEKLLYFYQRCRVASIYKSLPKSNALIRPLMFVFWKLCKAIGPKFFLNKIVKLSQKYSYDDSEFVGFCGDIYLENRLENRMWFEDIIDIPFEDRVFKAPASYDAYLKSLYGNYMQLPPEDKRVPHRIKAYYK